jgi:hypothetical protein
MLVAVVDTLEVVVLTLVEAVPRVEVAAATLLVVVVLELLLVSPLMLVLPLPLMLLLVKVGVGLSMTVVLTDKAATVKPVPCADVISEEFTEATGIVIVVVVVVQRVEVLTLEVMVVKVVDGDTVGQQAPIVPMRKQ